MAKVTVKNLGRLQAKLKKLDPLTKAAITRGVGRAGALVEGAAKDIVPVSTEKTRPGGPHGELRDSINTSHKGTPNGAEASVGTNKEYAPYVEFGTSKMQAQPYLRPALKQSKTKAKKIIIEEIVKAHKGI